MRTRIPQTGLNALTHSDRVRRAQHDGQVLYAAMDVVAVLTNSQHAAQYWADLKTREPALAALCQQAEFHTPDAGPQTLDAVSFEGLLRIVQSVPSPRAERLKLWLAR